MESTLLFIDSQTIHAALLPTQGQLCRYPTHPSHCEIERMVFHQVFRGRNRLESRNETQLKPKKPLEVGFSLEKEGRYKGDVGVESYYFSFLQSLKKSRSG